MTRRLWIPLLIVLATQAGAALPAPPDAIADHLVGPSVVLHGHSGDIHAFNIVIVGDGFTADTASMQAYRAAADGVAAALVKTAPFSIVPAAFNIHRVDIASDEAGIDVPHACGSLLYDPTAPFDWARSEKHPNNFLETSWCASSAATGSVQKDFLDSTNLTRIADVALKSGVLPNVTVVLVNDWMFGATAWPEAGLIFVSIGKNLVGDLNPDTQTLLQPNVPGAFPGVAVHELGHMAPFLLLDEYGKRTDAFDASTKSEINSSPNLATGDHLAPVKWATLVTEAVPTQRLSGCATPPIAFSGSPLVVGAFERGHGFQCDVFHAQPECLMGTTVGNFQTPLCLVCRRRLLGELAAFLPALNFKEPHLMTATTRWGIAAATTRYWLVLERLTLKSGTPGLYSLTYAMSYGSASASGVWPQASGVQLQKGDIVDIGRLAAQIGPVTIEAPLASPPVATVVFRLAPTGGSANAAGREVFTFTPTAVAGASMFVIDRPRFRLVVSVIAQR